MVNINAEYHVEFLKIVARRVYKMYNYVIKNRTGNDQEGYMLSLKEC